MDAEERTRWGRARAAKMTRDNASPPCPDCGVALRVRYSPANDGFFWGCPSYPNCKVTVPADPETGAARGTPISGEAKEWQAKVREVLEAFITRPGPQMNHDDALKYIASLAGTSTRFSEMSIGDCKRFIATAESLNIVSGRSMATLREEAKPPEEPEKVTGPSFGRVLDI